MGALGESLLRHVSDRSEGRQALSTLTLSRWPCLLIPWDARTLKLARLAYLSNRHCQ